MSEANFLFIAYICKPNSQVIKDITVTFILWHIYVYINLTWSLKMFFDSFFIIAEMDFLDWGWVLVIEFERCQ